MDSKTIREKFIKFFVDRGHKEIAPAKLVPENDPTTLFTSSGMQPLVPYLLGQEHPEGKRLVNSQPSFRAEDIEEVGDNRHTTFFEMLGNWSLGDYFKKEQLPWFWEFLTKELGLPKEKLYVSVFDPSTSLGTRGNESVPKDNESYEIWKSLGVPDDHIFFYGVEKNWWSRSGPPSNMPPGEPGGPDSEVFYEFTSIEHNKKFGEKCHPNCDCGRFMEICNSVFIQYKKKEDGTLEELSQKNVDFGGGLERLTAATDGNPDVFQTDFFKDAIDSLQAITKVKTDYEDNPKPYRVIVEHLRAAIFIAADGVIPSNKEQGYVLRRLIRRCMLYARELGMEGDEWLSNTIHILIQPYSKVYPELIKNFPDINMVITHEVDKFRKTINQGLKEFEKYITAGEVGKPETQKKMLSPKDIFTLYETFGFPYELSKEEGEKRGIVIPSKEEFEIEAQKHRELSRSASAGMFKGGLADHSEVVTKYHTATHLLHQALRDVLGPQVFQKGSNITSERLRFDFSYDKKMTDEEIKKTEEIINKRIDEDLKVDHMIIPLDQAKSMNAIGLFDEKYADKVSIYGVGPSHKLDADAKDQRERGGYYSLEFCGGPHVEHTGTIGGIKITKEEAISAGIRRIRAQLVN